MKHTAAWWSGCLGALVALVTVGMSWTWSAASPGPGVPSSVPPPGLRGNTPQTWAIVQATVVPSPGEKIERGVVIFRDGKLVAVGDESTPVPPEARRVELPGKWVYPGLIDAYGEYAGELPAPTGARHWNSRVTPELSVARHYRPDRDVNRQLRQQGIVARLVAPPRGIVKGTSVLVNTGDEGPEHAIVRAEVAQHIALTPGARPARAADIPEADRYPTSPMGAMSLVRQTLLDALWYERAWKSVAVNRALPHPEKNDALQVLGQQLAARLPLMIDAPDELYALRADAVGQEFGMPVIIRGSGQEFRLLREIAATGRAVVIPLAFPRPPNVATPEQANATSLMDLMAWDLAPENPARLDAAGVRFAVTTQGLSGARGETLLGQMRRAVARGLSEEAALRALTMTPARLFRAETCLGSLEPGKCASLLVTDGPLFAERTRLLETWVDGVRFEHVPAHTIDPRGRWEVSAGTWRGELTLGGELNRLSGRVTQAGDAAAGEGRTPATGPAESPGRESRTSEGRGGETRGAELSRVSMYDSSLAFSARADRLGGSGTGTAVVSATLIGDQLTGNILFPDGRQVSLSGRRVAPPTRPATTAPATTAPTTGPSTRPALYEPNWPLGEYGRYGLPEQPASVVFSNVTVWTGEAEGIISNGHVLVQEGKIAGVFRSLAGVTLPEGTLTIDGTGKHLTAGIIDAHSHMATDGGINESGQTISAETRIGDYIDPTDISIYRQLAGGVTAASILHGSANTIGGQNQVIKLRWGATPEGLKMAGAPEGIKFALGENPKQSNWGETFTTRYPQSRMGVEQLVRDAFAAAKAYREAWKAFTADPRSMLPPRKDLELEAIAEILEGSRWVHCHAYRQDEMLALLRTCADWSVTIGSFQHVLEGYKIADELARAGVTASGFSDWWAFKIEVYDAIPYAPALMWQQGVVTSLNSDDAELARRLNLEAAKAMKYGRVPPEEAWKMVTLNPAKSLRIDDRVGSIKAGKEADLVLWSGPPMSTGSKVEQTWIDGRKYWCLESDRAHRDENRRRHAALVQKVLGSGETPAAAGDPPPTPAKLWPNHDEFCFHGSDDGHIDGTYAGDGQLDEAEGFGGQLLDVSRSAESRRVGGR